MKIPSSAYISTYNDVTKDNLESYFLDFLPKLKKASHMAIDFEFTGLARPRSTDMNHRYLTMKKVIEEHSIVSFGVSIMKRIDADDEKNELDDDCNNSSNGNKKFSSSQPIITSDYATIERKNNESEKACSLNDTCITKSVPIAEEPKHSQTYECDNYNFLTLKEGPLLFSTGNAQFLAESGFSFDKLIHEGIPFIPPGDVIRRENEREESNDTMTGVVATTTVRDTKLFQLWKAILGILKYNNIPLILHNGLHDLMYLYHSFIGKLPNTLSGFIHSISNHFPSGIYDTKYLAYELNFNATFLSYVFAKADRLRQNRFMKSTKEEPYFEVIVNKPIEPIRLTKSVSSSNTNNIVPTATITITNSQKKRKGSIDSLPTTFNKKNNKKKIKNSTICKSYAAKGWCELEKTGHSEHHKYSKLHDIQYVLDWEMGNSEYPQVYTSNLKQGNTIEGAHSAHFDAYMTAFSFCYFIHTIPSDTLKESINKIKLDFMPYPLRFPLKINESNKS
ncbi:ribonuclease H-like domain-containing protein [Cokeromyces recurvatus]|uniref:ribonuclease H-like domain-containing protein n=1 Tax=Cokeromyces recurvatus TaxID=90255 RepID=UPI00221F6515|nr:ribonuclease H-like domain-containing protein [Cokeromyces recurvatus]KAI7901992.1 ribonuclease H-like domain-containing protein [Cokeromyces recurvatus]